MLVRALEVLRAGVDLEDLLSREDWCLEDLHLGEIDLLDLEDGLALLHYLGRLGARHSSPWGPVLSERVETMTYGSRLPPSDFPKDGQTVALTRLSLLPTPPQSCVCIASAKIHAVLKNRE
jgi:hypothetical protein